MIGILSSRLALLPALGGVRLRPAARRQGRRTHFPFSCGFSAVRAALVSVTPQRQVGGRPVPSWRELYSEGLWEPSSWRVSPLCLRAWGKGLTRKVSGQACFLRDQSPNTTAARLITHPADAGKAERRADKLACLGSFGSNGGIKEEEK